MDIPTFITLLRSDEMDAAARDLGRNFAANNPGDLRDLQRQIAVVARDCVRPDLPTPAPADGERGGDFSRGFLQALAMVASGFQSERTQRERAEADLGAARARKHWMSTLAAILDDCVTPGDIAKTIGVDASTVSRVLSAMEDVNLLVRRDPDEGEDGRTRPFALTPRGNDLCGRLFAPSQGPVGEIVEAAVACTALLFAVGRVSRSAIRGEFEKLGSERAEAATASLTHALRGTCLAIVDDDESVVAPIVDLHREFDRALDEAMRAPEEPRPSDVPIVAQLARLADGETLFFRTSNRFSWDVLVGKFGLSMVRIVRDDECLPEPGAGTAYRILYESRAVLVRDREEHSEWLDAMLLSATTRNVFDVGLALPPDDLEFTSHRPGAPAPGGVPCRN